jgi:hypothetical protein
MDGRRAGGLLVAAVLAAGLASCGGTSAQAEAQDLILGATDATYEAGTAQVLVTIGDEEGEGQVDFENGQSAVTATVDGQETTVFVDGADVLVEVDDVVTVVDPDELDVLGLLQDVLIAMAPGALVQLLQGLDGEVEILDDEEIDGVPARHYAFHVDADTLLGELDGELRDLLELLLAALGQDGLDVEVWIDDDGRLVQFQAEFDLGEDEPTPVVVGLSDFGSEVDIRIPEAGEALSAEEFGLATADIGGRGWVGSNEVVSSTVPGWYDVGPLDRRFRLNLECTPGGSCVNQVSEREWTAAGPGTWTISDEFIGDCTDTVTGEVTAVRGYRETSEFTWTVTAYDEEGNATELSETGTVRGEVIGQGLATGCTLTGQPGGPTTGEAVIEGQATRG